MKHVTPGQGLFWPQGHNLNKLGRGLLGDATYLISGLYALCHEDFLTFPNISLYKTCDPGAGPFLVTEA